MFLTEGLCQMTEPVLFRCESVSRRFGEIEALTDVGFSVQAGEILGIIGPNGAGKTTLMECLAGLQPCQSIALYWQERPLPPAHARDRLFYLPDGVLPWPDESVATVLRLFRRLHGAGPSRYETLRDRLRLGEVMGKRVGALSKGYRRRLLLAIGLMASQPLLLLDEPFDGFDLRQTLGVMALLRETLAERTLLLSIHQLSEAEKICDRFLLLNEGRVTALGTLVELREQAGLDVGGLEEVFLVLV